ncbi:MAG: NIF family HAD-type phosphatase [Bdellovibrionales bacterium]
MTRLFVVLGLAALSSQTVLAGDKPHRPSACEVYATTSNPYVHASKPGEKIPKHWQYLFGEDETYPRFKIDRVDKSQDIVAQESSSEHWIEKSDRFKIDELMKDYNLTRLEAAEVQAQYRRKHKLISSDFEFEAIVNRVRAGHYMSGLNPKQLAKAPAVIVLDIDGTLLDQDSSKWHDDLTSFSFRYNDKLKGVNVAMAPGWDDFLRRIMKLDLPIVLYSRNSDYLVHALADFIKLDGKPISQVVSGILSSSHMVDTGSLAKASVFEQTSSAYKFVRKDLRLIGNPNMILVDDDATYIRRENRWQMHQIPKFDVEDLVERAQKANRSSFSTFDRDREERDKGKHGRKNKRRKEKKDRGSLILMKDFIEAEKAAHRDAFDQAAAAIEESLALVHSQGLSLLEAHLPYSYPMQEVIEELLDDERSGDFQDLPTFKDETEVFNWIRQNPEQARNLVGKKKKKKEFKKHDSFGPLFPPWTYFGLGSYGKDDDGDKGDGGN